MYLEATVIEPDCESEALRQSESHWGADSDELLVARLRSVAWFTVLCVPATRLRLNPSGRASFSSDSEDTSQMWR